MQVQKRHFMTCQCFFIVRSNTSSPATVGRNIVEIPLSFDILHTYIYKYKYNIIHIVIYIYIYAHIQYIILYIDIFSNQTGFQNT